ncbi:hypothetical protein HMN09_00091100 [Mycena chlorophos]|uniref:Cupredoxin n=1 Tax=Mycena chlorophos TaxID=658473 RepID=A0A8H6WSJ8_MYCCL|nr:hypothetical protein HMN09_00091100 [Mycena chlorophos]
MFAKLSIVSLCLASLAVIPRPARSAVIDVTVGGTDIIAYTPNQVTANVGDTIVFTFLQKNHSVTQSTLDTPCAPLANGFDSGFVPVSANQTSGFPQAQLTVESTDPIWIYCRQTNHCAVDGMVFAVNPGNNFATFQHNANGTASGSTSGTASVVTVTTTVTAGASTYATTYTTSSPAATGAVSNDHVILVGANDELVFSPNNITAQPGDTVTFIFQNKNHTVTQSSFGAPCEKLSASSAGAQVGFDSGFMPVAANTSANNLPAFTIQINNTQPIWGYCRQTGHCGQGMNFAINAPTSGNTFSAFQAKAVALNGTASASASGASSTSNSAVATTRSAGSLLALGALVLGLAL